MISECQLGLLAGPGLKERFRSALWEGFSFPFFRRLFAFVLGDVITADR
jgi:hypothetical protein